MINPFNAGPAASNFRLIPEIENMGGAVKFAQSKVGKVFIAFVFTLIFSFSGKLDFFLFSGLIFLMIDSIPVSYRMLGFFFFLPFTRVFQDYPKKWGILPREQFLRAYANIPGLNSLDSSILWQVLSRACLFGAIFFFLVIRRYSRIRFGIRELLLVWIGCLFLLVLFANFYVLSTVLWGLVVSIGVCGFPLAYYLIFQTRPRIEGSVATGLAMILQNLIVGAELPLIRAPGELGELHDGFRAKTRLKALKLLIWSRALDLFRNIILTVFFAYQSPDNWLLCQMPSLHWPNYLHVGNLGKFLSLDVGAWQIWLTVLINAFCFVLEISAFTGYSIALLRLVGIYVPRCVFRPYLARSFNEYFRRILFFYSEVLLNFFFYPAWNMLREWVRRRSARMLVSLFYAVFVGGLFFHFVKDAGYFFYFGAQTATAFFFYQLPYYAAVATVTCVSSIWPWAGAATEGFWRWIGLLRIFVTHAILLTFIGVNPYETWSMHWQLFRTLFVLRL